MIENWLTLSAIIEFLALMSMIDKSKWFGMEEE